MELIKSTAADVPAVVEIYDAVRNGQYCVWNENYPTVDDASRDCEAECLYILANNGEIIGCASVEPIAEDDDLPFWQINDGTHREISRIAVSPDHQGKGYARLLTGLLVHELEKQGINSIHLLAAKSNLPAVKTYRALGFDFIGECYRYGADYYVCEKLLNKTY